MVICSSSSRKLTHTLIHVFIAPLPLQAGPGDPRGSVANLGRRRHLQLSRMLCLHGANSAGFTPSGQLVTCPFHFPSVLTDLDHQKAPVSTWQGSVPRGSSEDPVTSASQHSSQGLGHACAPFNELPDGIQLSQAVTPPGAPRWAVSLLEFQAVIWPGAGGLQPGSYPCPGRERQAAVTWASHHACAK